MDLPTGTIAKASAFFSSNSEASGAGSSKPCQRKKEYNKRIKNGVPDAQKSHKKCYIQGAKRDSVITNKSGGSTTGASTFTGSGGGDGGDLGRSCSCSCSSSGVFLYSMAKTSLGAAILLSTTCSVGISDINSHQVKI